MGNGNLRSARTSLIALAVALGLLLSPLTAQAAENCYYDPVTGRVVCDDSGGGGGTDQVTDYWTSWRLIGACFVSGGGGGGLLVDIISGRVVAIRDHIVDGEIVGLQSICIDLKDSQSEMWHAVAAAAATLPDPGWQAKPDGTISKGLTGLDTWLWYSNPSQVGPIDATWTEPVTGLVFGVEGRGWTESITWDTGEGSYEVFAPIWEEALGIGGTADTPAATHLYNTTSADAGYTNGYPVSVKLHWVGEYQVRVIVGVWTNWTRFSSTLTETYPATYQVVEVRSELSG